MKNMLSKYIRDPNRIKLQYSTHKEIQSAIHDRLKKNIGNQVLMVEQDFEVSHGCVKFLGGGQLFEKKYLGIIEGMPMPVKEDMDIKIPTFGNHLYQNLNEDIFGSWVRKNKDLTVSWFYSLHLDVTINPELRIVQTGCFGGEPEFTANSRYGLQLLVGDGVEDYFRNSKKTDMDEILKREVLDTSYVTALKLLDRQAPSDFMREYDKALHKKQIETISKLEEKVEELKELQHDAENIVNKLTEKKGYYYERGDGMEVFIPYKKKEIMDQKKYCDKLVDDKIKEIKDNLNTAINKCILLPSQRISLDTPGKYLDSSEFINGLKEIIKA